MQKKFQIAAWILIVILGLYIIYRGFAIAKESRFIQKISGISGVERMLETMSVKTHMPGLTFAWKETDSRKNWMDLTLEEIFPLHSYAQRQAERQPDIESLLEYELMVEAENQKEEQAEAEKSDHTQQQTEMTGSKQEADGSGQEAAGSKQEADGSGQEAAGSEEETAGADAPQKEKPSQSHTDVAAKDPKRPPVAEVDEELLRDYDYLLNNFFAVDPSTTPLESQINYDLFMSKDLKLTTDSSVPQILIYHTHSQEAFIDSVEGDVDDTIVGVGKYLTKILTETYGFHVIHHTAVYDMIDGELDRNKAYTLAAPDIQQILDENPSIEVVIDLHRDGVDGHKFVTEIDGKPVAQIMFFNGLSRTAMNGEIDYLPNPFIEDNLAFSFQLQLKAAQYYPGWTRNIYLQSLRYNLHMRPRALLIESGTQLNTVQEEMNSMELLGDILNQVLRGE